MIRLVGKLVETTWSQTKNDCEHKATDRAIHFEAFEPIFMDVSKKYNLEEILDLAPSNQAVKAHSKFLLTRRFLW